MKDSAFSDISSLLLAVRERWLTAAIIALLVAGSIGYFLFTRPPVYQAVARLLIERTEETILEAARVVDTEIEREFLDASLATHTMRLTTQSFLNRVANTFSNFEIAKILGPYGLLSSEGGEMDRETLKSFLADHVHTERSGSTMLIDVFVNHREPEVAQLIANRTASEYIKNLDKLADTSVDSANLFLTDQSKKLQTKIGRLEEQMQDYRESNMLVAVKDEQNVVVDRLTKVNEALTTARLNRIHLESRTQHVDQLFKDKKYEQFSIVVGDLELIESQAELNSKLIERDVLSERYGKSHPFRISNREEVTALEERLRVQASSNHGSILLEHEQAVDEQKRLQAEYESIEQDSLKLNRLAVDYEALFRELEATEKTYLEVLDRKLETDLAKQLNTSNLKFVDPAIEPKDQIWPNMPKILLVVMALGGGIFLAYPIGMSFSDNRVKSYNDLSPNESTPLLMEIPMVKCNRNQAKEKLVIDHTSPPVVESFKGMYSQITELNPANSPLTILVTSAAPNEGKTFIACNLASTFAMHGKRTLIVDMDFRRPSLHKIFGLGNNVGLLEWIKDSGNAVPINPPSNKSLGITSIETGLSLLRAGGLSSGLLENLEMTKLPDLFKVLRKSFDIIIFDTPPAGVFLDAECLSKYTDEVIFVSRFNQTKSPFAQQALWRISERPGRKVSIIMNGMPTNRGRACYYAGKYYSTSKYYKSYQLEA